MEKRKIKIRVSASEKKRLFLIKEKTGMTLSSIAEKSLERFLKNPCLVGTGKTKSIAGELKNKWLTFTIKETLAAELDEYLNKTDLKKTAVLINAMFEFEKALDSSLKAIF